MLASIVFTLLQGLSAAPAAVPQETWDELARQYEQAFQDWASALQRSGGFAKPVSERPPSPAIAFWPRFEALADQGEGRAVLWMLANPHGVGPEREARGRALFARVKAAGEAEWVPAALHELGGSHEGVEEAELLALLEDLKGPSRPVPLRVAALLAWASLVDGDDPAVADRMRTWAALLQHRSVDDALDVALAPEDANELAEAVVAALEKAKQAHFELAYREGPDGVYYPVCGAPPSPEDVWRPVVETLAEQGSARAALWVMCETYPRSEEEKALWRRHLDTLAEATLAAEDFAQLGWRVGSYVEVLGAELVEPRVRKWIERAPDAQRAALLFGLGDGLCESAASEEQRERGLAALREVRERWPSSRDAKRAEGKLFRHENLVVGKKVPDFEAVDADGNAFKLSDYLGKVTVIDFWGFW